MQPIKKIASILAFFSFTAINCQESAAQASLLVCYGDINPDRIQGYKYVVLESEQFNSFDINLIKENNDLVLGYISLGEVSSSRYYFDQIREKTTGKNPIWDSYYLDLEDSTTQEAILGLVEKISKKGFNGLFLDTVDVFGPWGPQASQVGAYIKFIALIKEKYPELHLMQNSGLAIVPRAKDFISSIAIESIATNYNFDKGAYQMRKASEFREKVEELKTVNTQYGLPILLIEYANTNSMIRKVKKQISDLNWDYFIGEIGLEDLPKIK